MHRATAALIALVLLSGGCHHAAAPDEILRPGIIDTDRSHVEILQAPPSVRVGEEFPITVTTIGSSSCTRTGGARLEVSGRLAEVTPLDWIPADPQTACTRDLRPFPREVRLRFQVAGEATIRVHGRSHATIVDGAVVHGMISVDATIRVEP